MKIEFDFKRAGLVEARSLKVQQFFVNGGIMSQPNVFMVVEPWRPPGKAYDGSVTLGERLRDKMKHDPDREYITVFNMTQGHLQHFGADKMVAVLNVVLKVQGYADPRAEQALGIESSDTLGMANVAAERNKEHNDYKVNWMIDLSAEDPYRAACQALDIMQDKNSTATIFHVTDQFGHVTSMDLGKQSPAGHGG